MTDWFLLVSAAFALLAGLASAILGALGWGGGKAIRPWERGTAASRAAGRNQLLLGLMIALNGANLMLPGQQGSKALALLAILGIVGYFALLILHRHRYGPPPPPRSRFAEDRR